MGCCLSSTDKSPAPNQHQHFQKSDDSSRAPPPVDEETVKEVLSETPTPKPKPKLLQEPVFQDQIQKEKTTQQQEQPVFEVKLDSVQEQKRLLVQKSVFEVEKWEETTPIYGGGEISEAASEIRSLQSESVSATTVTRDEDDEVQQRIVLNNNTNRVSPRKLQKNPRDGYGTGRVVGKSPTRRTDSSPGRRYGPNGNGVGSTRSPQPGQQRRVGLRAEPNRRGDPGDSSGRRSRSPATRVTDNGRVNRTNVGRSPSANRRYPSPNPVGPVRNTNNSTRRIAEEHKTEEGNESLENPLVSLECFIFL